MRRPIDVPPMPSPVPSRRLPAIPPVDDALYRAQMTKVLRKRVLRSLRTVLDLWEAGEAAPQPPFAAPFAPPPRFRRAEDVRPES